MAEKSRKPGNDLDAVREVFESFGRRDAMFAALTRAGYAGRWDAEDFFKTGSVEIGQVMARLAELGLKPGRGRALDFGCAVGRLTQGLAEHFAEVIGVDIAAAMVEQAREHNRYGDRVRYVVNTQSDLRQISSGSIDMVYTNKVLQHIPPRYQAEYVSEFVRVLRPGGVAVFQMRNGPRVDAGTLRSWLYRLNRIHFRRFAQRIRGKQPYEMHYLARSIVEEVVAKAGGKVVHVADLSRGRPQKSLRYFVTRPA